MNEDSPDYEAIRERFERRVERLGPGTVDSGEGVAKVEQPGDDVTEWEPLDDDDPEPDLPDDPPKPPTGDEEWIPDTVATPPPIAPDDPTYEKRGSHAGGMAAITVAEIAETGRRVAIKHPKGVEFCDHASGDELLSIGPNATQQFQKEIDAWTEMSEHRHVVTVLDSDSHPLPHIVLEDMERGSLRTRLRDEQIDLPEALWIGECLADAKWYATRRGRMHLDLKPENVLFTDGPDDGTWPIPKVGDWGLAETLRGGPPDEVDGLTPGYVAPEQHPDVDHAPDHHTDIFQLGVVVYELVTGELPYTTRTTVDGTWAEATVEPPSALVADVSTELDDVLAKALALDPDERYPSTLDFKRALRSYRRG